MHKGFVNLLKFFVIAILFAVSIPAQAAWWDGILNNITATDNEVINNDQAAYIAHYNDLKTWTNSEKTSPQPTYNTDGLSSKGKTDIENLSEAARNAGSFSEFNNSVKELVSASEGYDIDTVNEEDARPESEEAGLLQTIANVLTDLGGAVAKGILKIVLGLTAAILQFIFIPLASLILVIAGNIFNTALLLSINHNNLLNNSSSLMANIETIWVIVRDVFNICFIFVLLYAAIGKILNLASISAEKIVKNVVLTAFLINFSLPIAIFVIDIGNLLAVQIIGKLAALPKITVSGTAPDIAANIINNIKLQDISLGDENTTLSVFTTGGALLQIANFIFIAAAAYTFCVAAFLVIGRFVMIVFLLALSPIGFVGTILPSLKEYSSKWWKELFNQAALAPILCLLFYVVLVISANSDLSSSFNDAMKGVDSFGVSTEDKQFGIIFRYMLTIAFLLIGLKHIKKMSGAIGETMSTMGGAAFGMALGAATGGAAFAGRALVGRGAANLASSKLGEKLKDAEARGGFAGGLAGLTLKGIKGTSNASFDARNSIMAKATGNLGLDKLGVPTAVPKFAQSVLGPKVGEGGYDKWRETRQKAMVKDAEQYRLTSDETKARATARKEEEERLKSDVETKYADDTLEKKLTIKNSKMALDAAKAEFAKGTISQADLQASEKRLADDAEALATHLEKIEAEKKAATSDENVELALIQRRSTAKQKQSDLNDLIKKQEEDLKNATTDTEKATAISKLKATKKAHQNISAELSADKKDMRRKDHTTDIRKRFFSMGTSGENKAVAGEIEKKTEKEDDQIDKAIEKALKARDKKEKGEDDGGEDKKDKK